MTTASRPAAPSGAQASRAVQRHTGNQSTAVATVDAKREEIFNAIDLYADEITKLAPRGTTAGMYRASLRSYLIHNPKVLDCTPASIAQGMLRVAQTGLSLGEGCDLLPFGNTCQFSPRYNGLVELAIASGVRALNADVVREGDFFEWEKGTSTFLRHKRLAPDSAKITHAYAVAEIKVGSCVLEVIPVEHVEKTRQRYSKQWKSGPIEDIPWYARKTAVRRLASMLPKNPRFAAALAFEEEIEADDEDIPEAEVTHIETVAISDGGERQAESTEARAARPGLATEGQTEQLLDLIEHPAIPDPVKEKVKAKLKTGLRQNVADTWIEALSQEVAKHAAPAAAVATDDDSLGL